MDFAQRYSVRDSADGLAVFADGIFVCNITSWQHFQDLQCFGPVVKDCLKPLVLQRFPQPLSELGGWEVKAYKDYMGINPPGGWTPWIWPADQPVYWNRRAHWESDPMGSFRFANGILYHTYQKRSETTSLEIKPDRVVLRVRPYALAHQRGFWAKDNEAFEVDIPMPQHRPLLLAMLGHPQLAEHEAIQQCRAALLQSKL